MIKWLGLGCSLTLTLATACADAPDDVKGLGAVGEEQSEISGGSRVLSNVAPYSSAVALSTVAGGLVCSGVKIGARRFLTAGHCITLVDPKPATGARIKIANSLDGSGATTVKIDRFYPHPGYRWKSANPPLSEWAAVKDIAIIDVATDTPSIPALPADTGTFGDGYNGTDVAYGCDDFDGTALGKKQVGDFYAASLAQFQNFFVSTGYPHATAYANFMIFDGRPRYPGANPNYYRQLCPGDSGGPMFSFNDGWKVAGINSHRFNGGLTPPAVISATARVAPVTSWLSASNKIRGDHGSITNALTGKCLGVNGSIAEGAAVVQELCSDATFSGNSQVWRKEGPVNGYYRFINNRSSKCLHAEGVNITQRTCQPNAAEQRWLILAGSPTLTPLINDGRGYAGVRDAGQLYFGSSTTDLGADEGGTRQRWIWTE